MGDLSPQALAARRGSRNCCAADGRTESATHGADVRRRSQRKQDGPCPSTGLNRFGPYDGEGFTPKSPRIAVLAPRQFQAAPSRPGPAPWSSSRARVRRYGEQTPPSVREIKDLIQNGGWLCPSGVGYHDAAMCGAICQFLRSSQTAPATAPRRITAPMAINQVMSPKIAPIVPYVLLSEMIVPEK